jgi:hypothetical protein
MSSQMSTAMMSAPSCANRTAWLRPCPPGRAGDKGDLACHSCYDLYVPFGMWRCSGQTRDRTLRNVSSLSLVMRCEIAAVPIRVDPWKVPG